MDSILKTSRLLFIVIAVLIASCSFSDSEQQYPYYFGKNDTFGAVNLLGPDDVRRAMKTVKFAKVYPLAVELNSQSPAYQNRTFAVNIETTPQAYGANQMTGMNDQVTTHTGIGTQIDGFAHIGKNFVYYNGYRQDDFFSKTGLSKLGTEKIPPIVTRGVVLNMADYFGVDLVRDGTAYNIKEIKGALKKQKINIEQGDVVIFHSGWLSLLGKDNERWLGKHPGLGEEGAHYLVSRGVVAIGSDSPALEVLPHENAQKVFPVHQQLLTNGVHILEALNTTLLVENDVDEFMFVLGVPKLAGTVQAIVNPIAIK